MFDIKITINGKTYKKSEPMLEDYVRVMEYNKRNQELTFLTDSKPIFEAVEIIAKWFGDDISEDDIKAMNLNEIWKTYQKIESNITEVFTGVPIKKALQTIQTIKQKG